MFTWSFGAGEKRNFVNGRDRRKRKKLGELSLESSLSATWIWVLPSCEKETIEGVVIRAEFILETSFGLDG